MNNWNVSIIGVAESSDIDHLSDGLAEKFNLPPFKANSIIASIPCTIKRNQDKETAQSYAQTLSELGFKTKLDQVVDTRERSAPQPLITHKNKVKWQHSKLYVFSLFIGFTVFFSIYLPHAGYLFKILSGGMYGPVFKPQPHYVYLSLYLLCKLSTSLLFTIILFRLLRFKDRLPKIENGKWLFLVGAFFILTPQILRLWTSSIQGGGASFALMNITAPFVKLASILFFIGIAKVLMGYKAPEPKESNKVIKFDI